MSNRHPDQMRQATATNRQPIGEHEQPARLPIWGNIGHHQKQPTPRPDATRQPRTARHEDSSTPTNRQPTDTEKSNQESNQPPDMSNRHPDKMRNQSRPTDNRPDMIRTTYPRQLEGMSSTPDT